MDDHLDGMVEEEEIVTTGGKNKKKNTRFSAGHDVLLLREVIARNPYTAAAGEVTTTWAAIAASLNAAEATFNIDGRRCRDRTTLLLNYFRKEDTASLRRSGSEEQYAEKEQLLQEIVDIQRDLEEQPKKKRKGSAASQEHELAEVIRSQAMSSLRSPSTAVNQMAAGLSSATMPVDSEDLSGIPVQSPSPTSAPLVKKRRLNKQNDVIAYLQAKQESDVTWREQELEVKKKELQLAEKKLEWEKERVQNEQKESEERWKFEKEEREERMRLEAEERRSLMDVLKAVLLNK